MTQLGTGQLGNGQLGTGPATAAIEAAAAKAREIGVTVSIAVVDVLVIGGGVVGAGVAVDAATRGLRTAIVEAQDWASGTSSRSSKLIHGGLRYLEMLDFGLVRESLHERSLLLNRIAPHLVQPVPFLYPLAHRVWERSYVGTGVLLYDTLAATAPERQRMPRHRHLTRRGALRQAPCLRPDALAGAVQYWDAQVDDARFTAALVRTAASYGALRVRASKGVHLVVPRERLRSATGIIARTERSVLFVIPWRRHWIIGTTDTDWDLGKDQPAASARDIDYLLEHVNEILAEPLSRDDVVAVYAGLRPLLAGGAETTAKLSREHTVSRVGPGLVVVAGGKFTTYRVMAAQAVDEAARQLGRAVPRSCTDRVPLVGAAGFLGLWNRRHELAAEHRMDTGQLEHLLHRHGDTVDQVLDLAQAGPALADALPGGLGYLRAEAVYAVTHEGARHLDDVLTRRTRLSIEVRDRGLRAAPVVAELIAPHLGWTQADVDRELRQYRAAVAAALDAEGEPDDRSAEAARRRALEIPLSA